MMGHIKDTTNGRGMVDMQMPEMDRLLETSMAHLPDYLRQRAVPTWYHKNQVVAFKDEEARYAYLVLLGEIVVQADYESGNYYAYAHIGPGRYISDLEVLSERMVFANTMTATEDTFTLRFEIEDFMYCLEEDILFLRSIIRGLAKAMFETSHARGKNHYRSSVYKLISLLLQYCQSLPQNAKGDIVIPYTRGQMASETGVNIKTVNRGVAALRGQELVSIQRGKVRVSAEQRRELALRMEDMSP